MQVLGKTSFQGSLSQADGGGGGGATVWPSKALWDLPCGSGERHSGP